MEKKKKPLVSVIITTFNNVEYLPRAIESVLHQTYPEIELIVVDDNPPESEARQETEKVMERYPQALYLKHPENRNGAAARNTGIRSAGGEYIAFWIMTISISGPYQEVCGRSGKESGIRKRAVRSTEGAERDLLGGRPPAFRRYGEGVVYVGDSAGYGKQSVRQNSSDP